MLFQSLLTMAAIRYAHTRTTDGYPIPFERERSVPLSSGVTKMVDHYSHNYCNFEIVYHCKLTVIQIQDRMVLIARY